MTVYEIVNPSDHVTIEAPDDVVAVAAVTLVSPFFAAAREGYTGGLFALQAEDAPDTWARAQGFDSFSALVVSRLTDVRDALKSAVLGDRELFEGILSDFTDDAGRDAFRARWDDHHRSSLNEIVGSAHEIAESMIVPDTRPEHAAPGDA